MVKVGYLGILESNQELNVSNFILSLVLYANDRFRSKPWMDKVASSRNDHVL